MTMRMKTILLLVLVLIFLAQAQSADGGANDGRNEDDYVVKKPGEITFTTGIVIEGRVEKPQVILILTKEKVKMEPLHFDHSFVKNITEPVRYNTFDIIQTEDKQKADERLHLQQRAQ